MYNIELAEFVYCYQTKTITKTLPHHNKHRSHEPIAAYSKCMLLSLDQVTSHFSLIGRECGANIFGQSVRRSRQSSDSMVHLRVFRNPMMTFLSFVPSFFPHRLANKLQPGAVKMNVTSKVSNPAMRANKEVGYCISFLQFSFNKLTTATNFNNLSCTPIGKKRYT